MKVKRVCLLLYCIVGASLLAVACNISNTTTTFPSSTTQPGTSVVITTTVLTEKPRYGGTLTIIPTTDVGVFDPAAQGQTMGPAAQLIIERRVGEDWSRGAAGTDEVTWFSNTTPTPDTGTGVLAESWEIPELGTIVFKVRRGVHWALNPKSEASRLMNGREVTADDWIASFNYIMNSPRSTIHLVPQLATTATMEKTGPWEVTLKTPIDPLTGWTVLAIGGVFPTEVIAKYGNMQDWRNVVGTGPFMLTDFVPGSSATLVRNPNYWQSDLAGPGKGNQLPYLDRVKMLIITELSTMGAAFNTGKVDFSTGMPATRLAEFSRSYPDIMYATYLSGQPAIIAMRLDKEELPYKDTRVRQALMMATDFSTLKNEYFEGKAEILGFPVTREAEQAYVPLDEMPESTQALFRYDPDRARDLLAEAGYPDGFTAKMLIQSAYGTDELAEIYKAMWAKAGINVEIQPRESGVFTSMIYARSYEDMVLFFLPGGAAYPSCLNLDSFKGWNIGYVKDPIIEAANREIQKHVIVDMPEAERLYRELLPYIVEQSFYLPIPSWHACSLWWPWLKNYHGETPIRLAVYYWIDQNLKK